MQVGIDENLVKDIIYIIYVWGCSALEDPLAVYLSNSPCKDDNARFTTVPLNLYMINSVEDIVGFQGFLNFW